MKFQATSQILGNNMKKHYTYKGETFKSRHEIVDLYRCNEHLTASDFECIYEPFEGFTFTRKKNVNYEEVIRQRLLELRNRNKKFNFWYSGGMDSHIILYNMKKFNIWPDEIISHVLYNEYTDVDQYREPIVAQNILNNYGIPKSVKLNYLSAGNEFFEFFLNSDEMWNHKDHQFDYHPVMMPAMMTYLYPPFNVDVNETHLYGGTYPVIRHDGTSWHFYIWDGSIDGTTWNPDAENFLISCPEFMNQYANTVIDFFERQNYSAAELANIANLPQREYKHAVKIPNHIEVFNEVPEFLRRNKFLRKDMDLKNEDYSRIVNYYKYGNSPKSYDLFLKLLDRKVDFFPKWLDKALLIEEKLALNAKFGGIRTKDYIVRAL